MNQNEPTSVLKGLPFECCMLEHKFDLVPNTHTHELTLITVAPVVVQEQRWKGQHHRIDRSNMEQQRHQQ